MRPGPRAHDVDVVGEEGRLAQVVGDQDDGEADLLPQVAQHAPQLLAREGVERGERLVEHQQRRLVDQRAAQRDALLHAAGELPGIALAEPVEPDGPEQRARLLAVLGLLRRNLVAMRLDDLEREQHVVDHLAPGQQVRVLERHAGDLHRPAHPVAEDDDLAGIGRTSPVTSFISDDLPQPEGPTTAANSPRRTVRLVLLSARTPPETPRRSA